MTQKKLTCAVMRGGTSKGVYLLREQLPTDPAALKRVLLAVMGSPDARQIDGLGGGEMLTSKVAMVAKSAAADADIDYHFAQVVPGKSEVDTSPTCGNILSGVGAFAIEFGLFPAADGETELVVRDVNTGAFVEQVVQTPGGRVEYAGDCVISGAPGAAAPVALNYLRFAGVKTGRLFPAGAGVVVIDGIETTCIDAAMPVVFAAAESFGLSGRESAAELQADRNFFARMESVRLAASEKMGLGDARGKVIPKFALVASPEGGGGGGREWRGGGGHCFALFHAGVGACGVCGVGRDCVVVGAGDGGDFAASPGSAGRGRGGFGRGGFENAPEVSHIASVGADGD